MRLRRKLKRLIYLTKTKQGKSAIWKQFSIVTEKNGKQFNFVSYDKCEKLFVYNGHKSGISGLRRHTCSVVLQGQSKLSFNDKALLPAYIKQDTIDKCVALCHMTLLPGKALLT